MALNKREKTIAAVVGICVLIWVADSYVVEPFISARQDLTQRQSAVDDELKTANDIFANRRAVNDQWKKLTSGGLKSTATEAESSTLHALTDWAEAARVNLETHKTDTPSQVGDFQQVRITVTGAGSMAGISRLIWDIETGPLPLQMGELRIQTRRDGTDDLALQLTVTTLAFAPPPPAKTQPSKRTANGGTI